MEGYVWTFAFLLLAFAAVAVCWVLVASSQDTSRYNPFLVLLLVGTISIIVRVMYRVVAFTNLRTALQRNARIGNVPLKGHIASTCPEYNQRSIDEHTGEVVCTPVFDARIGEASAPIVIGSAVDFDTQRGTPLSSVDINSECAAMQVNAHRRPWLAMKKYCEYIGK